MRDEEREGREEDPGTLGQQETKTLSDHSLSRFLVFLLIFAGKELLEQKKKFSVRSGRRAERDREAKKQGGTDRCMHTTSLV